ncbi:hypothetical protein J4225_04675 [Candidatus Pacearchaeota archaeon]|nr:hypothetical protein [Candidatus Pacearchaeota archaeon]
MIPIKKEAVLVTPEDVKSSSSKFEVIGTFNPGATRMPNGDIALYVRVAEKLKKIEDKRYYYAPRCSGKNKCMVKIDKFPKKDMGLDRDVALVFKEGTKRLTFISHLRKVILDKSGFKVKSIDKHPTFEGLFNDGELGVEDPRITKLGKEYIMAYVSLSIDGNITTSCAVSKDALNWKRKGLIFREQNKDVVIFPEKINNEYVAFNRPEGSFQFSPPHIWISFSKDLKYWGNSKPIKLSERGKWDYSRVGAGAPPIKTKDGWLLLYHGVTDKKHHSQLNILPNFLSKMFEEDNVYSIYSIGAALFDLKNPSKLIAKSPHPIIIPTKKYEKEGFVSNVIFTTGAIMDENEKDILIYSGGADEVVTVKKVALKDILNHLEKVKFKGK